MTQKLQIWQDAIAINRSLLITQNHLNIKIFADIVICIKM